MRIILRRVQVKKVAIRLVFGCQLVTGIVEGYNPSKLLIQIAKGQILAFKHTIAVMELVDIPNNKISC